jgi:nondiscriminating aspartyl-tRNA synthetase
MKNRVLVKDLHEHVDQEVTVEGWVDVRRDHGKLVFIDLRDRSGKVQMVANPKVSAKAHNIATVVRPEWVVRVTGKVNRRPEKMVNKDEAMGDVELEVTDMDVLVRAQELPFERDTEVNLDTLFDYRPLTLRSQRERDIFGVQATIVQNYRWSLINQGFTEFQAPALVGEDAEGGAAVFKVDYFNEKNAYLATSPQLYKQIMVGAFERVFTIAKIFRAEKSATTRHLSELTQMDFEMGFIENERDVMAVLETVIRDTVNAVAEKHADVFKRMNAEVPLLGDKFPILTLAEAHEELGAAPEDDMTPEHERDICEWAKKEHGTDFVFITRFPTSARAFYTMSEDEGSLLSRGFDLLFRGLEINSGAQRIHDYDDMVKRIKSRNMDPDKFEFYLQAFKFGVPPHGGCSTGLERITMKMLNLPNVREAVAFPRDMNRIDTLLSKD